MALEENVLKPEQEAYLEWLTTPPDERDPSSKAKYAEANGHWVGTLRRWEKLEPFRKEWEKRSAAIVGSPERHQSILDRLYSMALAGDVKAADLYLKATGKMAPSAAPPPPEKPVLQLTDDQLEELIAAKAATEKSARLLVK